MPPTTSPVDAPSGSPALRVIHAAKRSCTAHADQLLLRGLTDAPELAELAQLWAGLDHYAACIRTERKERHRTETPPWVQRYYRSNWL